MTTEALKQDYLKLLDLHIREHSDFSLGRLLGFESALHIIGYDVLREIKLIESEVKPDAFRD